MADRETSLEERLRHDEEVAADHEFRRLRLMEVEEVPMSVAGTFVMEEFTITAEDIIAAWVEGDYAMVEIGSFSPGDTVAFCAILSNTLDTINEGEPTACYFLSPGLDSTEVNNAVDVSIVITSADTTGVVASEYSQSNSVLCTIRELASAYIYVVQLPTEGEITVGFMVAHV